MPPAFKQATQTLNRYYPLLTDGINLFAVTVNVAIKRRRVKDSMRKHYQVYQEEKKKKAAASPGTKKEVAVKAAQKAQDMKEEKLRRRHEDRERRMLEELGSLKDDDPMKEKMLKELQRMKIKNQKEEHSRRRQEIEQQEKSAGAPPVEESPEIRALKEAQSSYENYKVCEFYVHEFDLHSSGASEEAIFAQANIKVPTSWELFDMPDIVELFSSFSSFFSIEECYKAYISCNSDVCEAAAWLVDIGEKERGNKSLVKKRCILIAESEISNNPVVLQPIQQEGQPPAGSGIRKPHDLDISVRENSVLHPFSINAGKWSISSPEISSGATQQISFHQLTGDNQACIKVFSLNQDDVHVLNEPKKKQAPTEAEEEVKGTEPQKQEVQLDSEKEKKPEENTEIDPNQIVEQDLFEHIKLKGTLLKQIKLQRSGPYADLSTHNTYLIYDHSHKKYYILLLGSAFRYIAVAEDLSEMYQLLKQQKDDQSTTEVHQKMTSLSDFAAQALDLLGNIGHARYNMPWRWRPWSNNYHQALTSWSLEQLELSGNPEVDSRVVAEQRKKQSHKLSTRIEKLTSIETEVERKDIGIPFDEKLYKKWIQHKPAAHAHPIKKELPVPSMPTVIKHQEAPKRAKMPELAKPKAKKDILDESIDNDWGSYAHAGDQLFKSPPGTNIFGGMTQFLSKKDQQREREHEAPSSELVLPKEKIMIYKETTKLYQYCPSGNIETLEVLFKLLQAKFDQKTMRQSLLTQILQWILVADTLVLLQTQSEKVIKDLRSFLIQNIEQEISNDIPDRELIEQCWRILILGWHLFCRSIDDNFLLMNLILKYSLHPIYTQPQAITIPASLAQKDGKPASEEKKPVKQVVSVSTYYTKMLSEHSHMSPIKLFYLRFHRYHASFYPLEVLRQSRVQAKYVVIDKINFPNSKAVSHYEGERQTQEDKGRYLQAKFYKFRGENNPFQYHRQLMDVSLAECKDYQTKNADVTSQINQAFFSVPLSLMSIPFNETIEDLENSRNSLDLDRVRALYTDDEFKLPFDSHLGPRELHEVKLSELETIRKRHADKSYALLDKFKEMISQSIQETGDGGKTTTWDDQVHCSLFCTYIEMIRQSYAQIEWNRTRQCDMVVNEIRFIDDMVKILVKKTNGFKITPMKTHHITWFNYLKELLTVVLYSSYPAIDQPAFNYLSHKALQPLLSLLTNIKSFFTFQNPDDKSSAALDNFLDYLVIFSQEGTDFSTEKVFETPHPYPRTEYVQKDIIQVHKAFAYSIEVDKRCSTEFNSDTLTIQSADHAFWVNDSFGTHIRLHGRSNFRLPFMILGNKISIEFRSSSNQNRGGGKAFRGGRGGFSQGNTRGEGNNNEEQSLRWGFKVTIRPIFGDPQLLYKNAINKEKYSDLMRKMGIEHTFGMLQLMNQMVYMTSRMTRQLLQANVTIPEEQQGISKYLKGSNTASVDLENLGKFMSWHLFKGGIRTDLIDKLHIPRVFEETLKASAIQNDVQLDQSYHLIEKYREAKECSKDEEGLRKRKQSISALMKDSEKTEQMLIEQEFQPNQDQWTKDIRLMMQSASDEDSFVKLATKKVRELVPYNFAFKSEKLRPNFKKEYQQEWERVEEAFIVAMLYHSNSLEETKKFLGLLSPQKQGQQQQSDPSSLDRVEEKLKLIGQQLNDLMNWMLSRLQGEQNFQTMLRDIVDQSQTNISTLVEKKSAEQLEAKIKREAAEEATRLKTLEQARLQEQDKKKLEEEKAKNEAATKKASVAVVSKDKVVHKAKRKNVVKMGSNIVKEADLLKMKKELDKKKAKKDETKTLTAIVPAEVEQKKEEESEEPIKKEAPAKEKQEIKFLELSPNEEKEFKQKTYLSVYEEALKQFQGNQERVKSLCQVLGITLNPEDPNENLKAIFKRVRSKLRTIIDFDGDLPIRETLNIDELKLESPYKEISKEVKARLLFLLELKPSIDYHAKVIRIDPKLHKRMFGGASQTSQDGDRISQNQFTESSLLGGDDDSEILEPLGIQRSQSVQVGLQPSLSGSSQGLSQALIGQDQQMNETEIANWIDSYRKWRQWNRQHKLLNKGGLDLLEEDLTSPYCSPLHSVISFAKASKVQNPDTLRKLIMNHQMKAALRIQGLKYQDELLNLFWTTPYQRLIISNLSQTLQESTFNNIETCGESLAQCVNEQSRLIVKQLMRFVIGAQLYIDNSIYRKDRANYKAQQQAKTEQKVVTQQAPVPPMTTQEKQALQMKQNQQKLSMQREEMTEHQLLKQLLQSLNEVRILLNDIYTREYVLESLRQSVSSSSTDMVKESLMLMKQGGINTNETEQFTFDMIKDFLKSVIELMLQFNTGSSQFISKQATYSSSKIQFAIAYACKLILTQFMSDKSMMRAAETHRLLQECLLDIVVDKLERLCGLKKKEEQKLSTNEGGVETTEERQVEGTEIKEEKKPRAGRPPGYKLNKISHQDEIVQLMKLLSEVIRISNDHQQHIQSMQTMPGQSESKKHESSYFLSEGSEKVMRCASILAFMMHHVEVPVIMRQTIKCAKLFFKLVDFRKLKLHNHMIQGSEFGGDNEFMIETLRQIGSKISNTQSDSNKQEEIAKQDEKQYVVYANINSSDEDFSFLITAFYHWENLYPTFTLEQPKDPQEIVIKSAPKEEAKEEEKKAEGVDLPDSLDSQAKQLIQQMQEMDSNVNLEELIKIQRQQIVGGRGAMNVGGRGGAGPSTGRGGYGGLPSNWGRGQKQMPDKPFIPNERYKASPSFVANMMKQQAEGGKVQSIFQYSQSVSISPQSIGIVKLVAIFDEMIIQTWEDAKEEDSKEEKERKLNEFNYNQRVKQHLKDAEALALLLYSRYTAPMSEAMPHKKALEFATLLQKAYKGELEPIQINPYMKQEKKEKKLQNSKTVNQHFPLIMKTLETGAQKQALAPGQGAPIVIAPKRLVVSLADVNVATKYEEFMEKKHQVLRQLEKTPNEGFRCNIISQSVRRQGASISVIIQEFITLMRSLITSPKLPTLVRQSTSVNQQPVPTQLVSQESEISYHKQQSLLKIQRSQETAQNELLDLVNKSIEQLVEKPWAELSLTTQQIIYGILAVVGGWNPPIKTGQPVQVQINNQWVDATVVDDGLGKKRLSVILDDDDQITIQKVPVNQTRPLQKFEWPFDSSLSSQINQQRLCEAVISVYDQLKAKKTSEISEYTTSVLTEDYLMMMLLKVTSQLKWYFMDRENSIFVRFMSILNDITKETGKSEEDKTKSYWERSFIDSWERLIDRSEDRNFDFFVIKENLLLEMDKDEETKKEKIEEEIKEETGDEKGQKLEKAEGKLSKELQSQYQDNDYVQHLSSYLRGLPDPIAKKNQSEAALKLLAYWEKNVIPRIIEFVKTTYRPWEMDFYFEQLRHHLRGCDTVKAFEDAMVMLERKIPQGCIIPDDNYDWTCKMIDECIVDSWALAKFKPLRVSNSGPSSSVQASSPQSSSSGDTNFPLLNKLINFGIDEIVVLIKAVDLRGNVVLAEYQDPDTMQIHSIWVPVSHLSDLNNPLPPRAVGYTVSTLKNQFNESVSRIESLYARQTLVQFFHSFQDVSDISGDQRIFQLPSQNIELQEIIAWSVWEQYSSAPIDGWMKELNHTIQVKEPEQVESTEANTISLQQIVQQASENIAIEQIQYSIGASNQSTLNIIKQLFEKTIKTINVQSEDTKLVTNIVDWCILNWYKIAERIRNDCAVFDICKEYDEYIKRPTQSHDPKSLQQNNLLPLHELIKSNGNEAIGTLLMFKKNAAHLTPTSKIQFYSDSNRVNLISEINAGLEGRKDLAPLMLNHGAIWVNFDSGTTALLPRHLQVDQRSSLPCAMVQIPNTWTVCCWLTEMITNCLLINVEGDSKFVIDIYEKLIGALTSFYEEAKAPSMLKSIVFNLLARLITKLRHIYSRLPQERKLSKDMKKELIQSHLKRIFVKKDFIQTLLSELLVHKDQEEHGHQMEKQQGSMLYSAFVQDCVELLLTMMMPNVQSITIDSYRDLLGGAFELPDWLEPLVKALYFMQYFSGEMKLSRDILREIHNETVLTTTYLDSIIILQGIPSSNLGEDGQPLYPESLLRNQILSIVAKHGARVLQPATDLVFSDTFDRAALLIDGFDHMQAEIVPEVSVDNEDSENEEEVKKEKVEAPKPPEKREYIPEIYNCQACTLENPISAAECAICGTPRPTVEQIIAEYQAAQAALNQAEAPSSNKDENQPEQKEVEKKSVLRLKLEVLSKDLRRFISNLERRAQHEKEQNMKEQLERLKKGQDDQQQKPQEPASKEEEKKVEQKKPVEEESSSQRLHRVLSHSEDEEGSQQNEDEEGSQDFGAMGDDSPREERRGGAGGRQALIDLGIDADIVDNDPDLAQVLAQSILEEREAEAQRKREVEQAEAERKKKEKEEEDKRKKREEQERLEKEAAEAGITMQTKVVYTKLKSFIGNKEISEDTDASRFLYKILRDRLRSKSKNEETIEESQEFSLSPEVVHALQQIHNSYQEHDIVDMCPLPLAECQLIEDFGITQKGIKEESFEELLAKVVILIEADVKQFYRFIETQGFDFWFHRAFHACYIIPEICNKMITINMLEKLKHFIEIEMCKESKGVVNLQPSTLRLLSKVGIRPEDIPENERPINYFNDTLIVASYPELLDQPRLTQADVRYQWALLRIFNKYLAPTVPFINTSHSVMSDLISSRNIPMRLAAYMSATRNLCLMNVKFDLRHLILEKTSVQREVAPKLYFDRLKLAHRNREQVEDNEDRKQQDTGVNNSGGDGISRKDKQKQLEFMYLQAYEQIKDMDLAQLRPKKPQGAEPHLSFHIVFRGEHVVGEGGPYRQFFADISSELQPVHQTDVAIASSRLLGLLCPSPNNKSKSNIGKGKFVLSPARTSSLDLSLFEFLGILMGVCVRTGSHLNLDLPQFVWKQLAGQRVGHEELIQIDSGFWTLLQFMQTCQKSLYDEQFSETWTVTLSDQETQVELRENGKEQRVEYEDRLEYIKQAINTRLKECSLQCAAIKRGIAKVIPEALLNMVTYNELETWVCGKAIVDVDLLKRHTKYGGDKSHQLTEDSRRIKWFWEVLRDFSEEDKQKFIKFCWGEQRLPANDEEFERRQTRFMIKPSMRSGGNIDGSLPKADTCFFNLELPDYSTKEIMRQRILLAIHTDCDSMNAEDVRNAGEQDGGGHRDEQDDYGDEY